MADITNPMYQANFFCAAPTYSGFWLATIKRAMIKSGANFGAINRRIENSITKTERTYLTGTKLPTFKISTKEMRAARNIIPAVARISLLFKTGIE